MFRLPTYLLGILFVFIHTNYAQVDPGLCPEGPTAPIPDPKWHTIPPRFEVITELISEKNIVELSQAFSQTRDSIVMNSYAGQYQFYYNFATDEIFDVLSSGGANPQVFCLKQPITAASETSVILPKTLFVKPSVLLGFDQRNQRNPNWGVRYRNDSELRRIPTNVFQSCFFLNDIRATVAVTYHVSNPEKFSAYLQTNQSIILQMSVTVKNQTAQDSYIYNVFRYVPNPGRQEERQALETPTGVYCPNRTSTMPIPSNIPERVSANNELFVPFGNQSSIVSTHALYDTEFQFARFDALFPDPMGSPFWIHFTEIHDFGLGLSFRYDNRRHQCQVGNISSMGFNDAVPSDENPSLLQMGSPQHLFLMDDVDYQYSGEKPCRDRVWCHVWIGEKNMPDGVVQHREWYWSSSINGEISAHSSPVKLIIKQYIKGVLNGSYEMNVFNFRRRPFTVFEIDHTLAECYRALGPAEGYNLGVITFRIINDKQYPIYQNLNYLRFHIWETLVFTMFARPTRISNLIVDQDDESNDIIVTFTLLDLPPVTGPIEDPIRESSFDTLVSRLRNIIDSNGLHFRARVGTKQVTLRARGGSLNVPHTSSRINWKSSGPKITGLWLGLIVVGILVGAVGGFLVLAKLAKK